MENQQAKVKSEVKPVHVPAQATKLKTRFDDAEYQRWNEKLKSRNSSKNK